MSDMLKEEAAAKTSTKGALAKTATQNGLTEKAPNYYKEKIPSALEKATHTRKRAKKELDQTPVTELLLIVLDPEKTRRERFEATLKIALGAVHNAEAFRALVAILLNKVGDDNPLTRLGAIEAVRISGNRDFIPTLQKVAVLDTCQSVCMSALAVLAGFNVLSLLI